MIFIKAYTCSAQNQLKPATIGTVPTFLMEHSLLSVLTRNIFNWWKKNDRKKNLFPICLSRAFDSVFCEASISISSAVSLAWHIYISQSQRRAFLKIDLFNKTNKQPKQNLAKRCSTGAPHWIAFKPPPPPLESKCTADRQGWQTFSGLNNNQQTILFHLFWDNFFLLHKLNSHGESASLREGSRCKPLPENWTSSLSYNSIAQESNSVIPAGREVTARKIPHTSFYF